MIMQHLFGSDSRASALRSLLRALFVVATSFGLKFTAEQVASVQVALEAALQFGRSWYSKGS